MQIGTQLAKQTLQLVSGLSSQEVSDRDPAPSGSETGKEGGPGCVCWKINQGHAFVKGARMLIECLECCLYLMKVQNSGTKTMRWNLSRRRSGGVRAFTGREATIHLLGFFSAQTLSSIFIHNLNFFNYQSISHPHIHTPLLVRMFL